MQAKAIQKTQWWQLLGSCRRSNVDGHLFKSVSISSTTIPSGFQHHGPHFTLLVYVMIAILVLPAMSQIGNAATGVKFTGDTTRKFTQARKFTSWQPSGVTESVSDCPNWAVVTTIFAPSEAVRRQSRMLDWCLVIVADKKTPATYDIGWEQNVGWNRRVEMLSVQRQQTKDQARKCSLR